MKAKKEFFMKKVILSLALIFTASTASALEFDNSYCDPATGDMAIHVKASRFDVYYHKNIIFVVRGRNTSDWKEISIPMSYPEGTYSANSYSMGLFDKPVQYNIRTSTTTLVVAACE